MPGQRCAVAVCNNSRVKTRELPGDRAKIYYHRFPKNHDLSKQWAQRCKRADTYFNPSTSVVCSEHFTPDDYERDMKAELLKIAPKKVLKPSAVPSVNLSVCLNSNLISSQTVNVDTRDRRIKARESKKIVAELVNKENVENLTATENNVTKTVEKSIPLHNVNSPSVENEILMKENIDLKKRISMLESKINLETSQTKKLKKENLRLKRKNNNIGLMHSKMDKILTSIFTKNQITLLLGMKKQVSWTSDEISLAFTLRYLSKRCYLFVKRKMKIPLPGLSTLQRWATRFEINQGIFESVFKYLELAKGTFQDLERIVVLQFDEIKVKQVLEYDTKNDKIVGPHSSMQVISARGLFSKWKQPLYADFDTQVTKSILCSIIMKLKETGYTVKACVSDMGGGNVGLWKQLGISFEKTYFISPTDDKVFVFADAPHVLKLIRNWLLDTGFCLSDGRFVTKDPIASVINMEAKSELKVCHKLTESHLTVKKAQRQNVRKAAELMSHTVATALNHYLKGDKVAESTSYFVGLVNNWFDLMNSYTPKKYGEPFERPYGQDLEKQDEILHKMANEIKNMRCTGKTTLQVFQKGCILSILSLQELYKDLKHSHNISYILTHRLNQDSLENLFSQIRSRGGLNDHPSPLDAIYRLRMIILGKNQGMLQANTNYTSNTDDGTETIVSTVLKVAGVQVPQEVSFDEENQLEFEVNNLSFLQESNEDVFDDSTRVHDLKDDALEYLAGWVAKKHKKEYPYLTEKSEEKTDEMCDNNVTDSWIKHLSYGGLTKPSLIWLDEAKLLNDEFVMFHQDNLSKTQGVVSKLSKIVVTKYPNVPYKVARTFIKQRMFIRLKFLNGNIEGKRKTVEITDRKTAKKFKKLTT